MVSSRPSSNNPAIKVDLRESNGGSVNGSSVDHALGPAFSHIAPQSMPLPVLVAIPHAGKVYPAEILAEMRDAELSQLRLEDRHVDLLGAEIAKATGSGLLIAHAPRAMLDLNRAQDDIDWEMIDGPRRRRLDRHDVTGTNHRARSGLGLVPRRLPGFGEVWRSRLPRAELDRRIERIHRPYHEFLSRELKRIGDAWGAALLIDLHSMPPLKRQAGQDRAPKIVLGDRFGASCDHSLLECAVQYLESHDCAVARNRPYSGGYVLDRHGAPQAGLHAVQVEVCRSAYLDDRLAEPGVGLAPLAKLLAGMVRELGAQTANLGADGRMAQAAE